MRYILITSLALSLPTPLIPSESHSNLYRGGEQLRAVEQPIFNIYTPPVTVHNYMQTANNMAIEQTHIKHTTTTIQTKFNQVKDQTQEYVYGIFSWIAQNKIKTALSGAAIAYGYIWYKLLSLNYALLHSTNWSHWHKTMTLEELLAKPQQEVATDLLTTIQRQYITPEQLDDLIGPLIAFVRDVDMEIAQLRELVHLHTWINRLRISFLFPKQTMLLEQAQENIHRLTYLKNLLLNWVSEHKVARLSHMHQS